jgi:DNA phosphorothioation-dependent restriction protein DptG
MPIEEVERAKDLLIKLYINLKIQKNENIEKKEDKISQEKQQLKKLSLLDLIKFISNYINCLLEIKYMNNELIKDENEEKPLYKQYEELLIKAENDIRKHIKVSRIFI